MDAWNTRFIEMCQENHAKYIAERRARLRSRYIRETISTVSENILYGIVLVGMAYIEWQFLTLIFG